MEPGIWEDSCRILAHTPESMFMPVYKRQCGAGAG